MELLLIKYFVKSVLDSIVFSIIQSIKFLSQKVLYEILLQSKYQLSSTISSWNVNIHIVLQTRSFCCASLSIDEPHFYDYYIKLKHVNNEQLNKKRICFRWNMSIIKDQTTVLFCGQRSQQYLRTSVTEQYIFKQFTSTFLKLLFLMHISTSENCNNFD